MQHADFLKLLEAHANNLAEIQEDCAASGRFLHTHELGYLVRQAMRLCTHYEGMVKDHGVPVEF